MSGQQVLKLRTGPTKQQLLATEALKSMREKATVAKNPHKDMEAVTVTPEMATKLLEANTLNRPLADGHVKRISSQISAGKWKFNGDTIKIADNEQVLDGQHRLWAVIDANRSIETIIVRGISPDAFSTIDTICRSRSFGDVIALAGHKRHRNVIGPALSWLLRWQDKRGIENYKSPDMKVENSDIEAAFANNPGIVRAAESAQKIRSICNASIMAFFYYVMSNRNPDLAERMMDTLEDPAGIGVTDPFFRLRVYLLDHAKKKEPLVTIALLIKAANAANSGDKIKSLVWRNQGKAPEPFPVLKV